MKVIKQRKAKKSNRGVYLQDKELKDTVFAPGETYKYVMDIQQKKMIILPSTGEGNTVSKRKTKDGLKPVIDIRNKEALALFNDAEYLQVTILQDQVIVEGYVEERTEDAPKPDTSNKEIKDITDILPVRKIAHIAFAKEAFTTESDLDIPLQVASLFSGAGILDIGFFETGYEIVFALEKDTEACETYRYNLGEHIVNADITTFDKGSIPKAPVMIGGSPCQGFSPSNRTSNYLDNPNNLLVKEYIEAIKANKQCKVFVLENVPQILTAGEGRFREEICASLSDFHITTGVLLAADYGAPQLRKRAFFIGSKIGEIPLPEPLYPPEHYRTVEDAFFGLREDIPNQQDYSISKKATLERIQHVPPGGNWRDIPTSLQTAKMKTGSGPHSSVYKRLRWDQPSITVTNPRKSNILHPSRHRSLSIRECARLFGVPDHFEFKGSLSSMQQQIANSVPVQLAKAVASKIKQAIISFNSNSRNKRVALV